MIMTNKLLPVALIAALTGGSVGALVMHRSQPVTAENTAADTTQQVASNQQPTTELSTPAEQTAYKSGFADGYGAAATNNATTTRTVGTRSTRVVYRNAGSRSTARRVYYDYQQPKERSFWQKHRDKLTVAMGAGGGAAIGALIGGKKGALIGGLSGAGGSALYTYKLRKRSPSY